MPNPRYRVGIDCRLAGRKHAGIGRYIEQLVRELLKQKSALQYVLFFDNVEQAHEVLTGVENPSSEIVITHTARHYSIAEQLRLPQHFRAHHLDLLHVPHFNIPLLYSGKTVVTIHDLLWHEYRGAHVTTLPAWKYWPKYLMYRQVVRAAVQKAQRIFVPTQTVAGQVKKYYPTQQEKIFVTSEGVEERFFAPLPAPDFSPKRQLVYLGSLYPHKNVRVVVDALANLPGYTLLLVSARSIFQEQMMQYIKEKALTERVKFLGYLSDSEVITLLQESTALVQPSLSEGFGLTGLEAMAAGVPVIASEIAVFQEVCREHATYFQPNSPESFVTAVRVVEQNNRFVVGKSSQSFAREYTWSSMAKCIQQHYYEVLQDSV